MPSIDLIQQPPAANRAEFWNDLLDSSERLTYIDGNKGHKKQNEKKLIDISNRYK